MECERSRRPGSDAVSQMGIAKYLSANPQMASNCKQSPRTAHRTGHSELSSALHAPLLAARSSSQPLTPSYCPVRSLAMQALLTRSTAALLRRNGAAPGAVVALARGADWPPQQQQQQRGLASERMVYGVKIPEDMKVSDPVRRVLSIDNSTM